jgi:hypothetical protein
MLWLLVLAIALKSPPAVVSRINMAQAWESGVRCPRRLAYSTRIVARRV